MKLEKVLAVVKVWLKVEEKILKDQEDGTWSYGRHYGSVEYLFKVKLLLEGKEVE